MYDPMFPAGKQFDPAPTLRPKYNGHGGFTTRTFQSHSVPRDLVPALLDAANHGLATNTHKSCKTAINHIKRVEKATGRKLEFPFTVSSTLTYVGYLLKHRKVGAATIQKYLSGIRMHHLYKEP